jgi:hypothetical protein
MEPANDICIATLSTVGVNGGLNVSSLRYLLYGAECYGEADSSLVGQYGWYKRRAEWDCSKVLTVWSAVLWIS